MIGVMAKPAAASIETGRPSSVSSPGTPADRAREQTTNVEPGAAAPAAFAC